KTSIKTITYLSDTGCLEIQGASLKHKTPQRRHSAFTEISEFSPRFECHKIHCHTSHDMTASKYTEYWRVWLIFNNQLCEVA
ncbi:hypothetical protein, partial [Shigella sonnei]|uniref:hypothetical protein n=1 Tax=Shigella sonnei TaxID=624 RepID=UPI000B15F049